MNKYKVWFRYKNNAVEKMKMSSIEWGHCDKFSLEGVKYLLSFLEENEIVEVQIVKVEENQ